VGIQTVNNVLFDDDTERYKMITSQVKDLCYGLYGKTPVPIDPDVQKKALEGYSRGETPITCRPAEILEPELGKAKEDVNGLAADIDDVLIYALYPVTGKRFLKWKYGKEEPPEEVRPRTLEDIRAEMELVAKAKAGKLVEKRIPEKGPGLRTFHVYVDDDYFEVGVEELGPAARPVSKPPKSDTPKRESVRKSEAAEAVSQGDGTPVIAPMPGMVVRYEKRQGDPVAAGDTIVVLEAMKMENAIKAQVSGTIQSIQFSSGDSVSKNDVLCVIE
jgi:biotin carboxyl carrier protein